MAEIVTAVYEQGVLRPLHPLGLKEHQRVRLQVLPEPPEKVEHAIRALIQAGLLTPPPGHSEVPPLSEQERRELSELLGRVPGKPLSEIIIEDRGEW
jgi:predicted DNA-binding antitoxin AbrB/MazE fold protein